MAYGPMTFTMPFTCAADGRAQRILPRLSRARNNWPRPCEIGSSMMAATALFVVVATAAASRRPLALFRGLPAKS